ncbi:MAG: peptidoglycan-associated lipoprotein Pal [Myxococcota bacterium]
MSHKVAAAIVALSLVTGCKHKPPEPVVQDKAQVTARPAEHTAAAVRELADNFSRVHFDTDSARLTEEAKNALVANAHILADHPELQVEVQGHADERGTVDYNLALGQRRANAVVSYMLNQGVAPSRLPVITYGEERPVARGNYETAWAQNRRAEFRILAGPDTVHGTTDI